MQDSKDHTYSRQYVVDTLRYLGLPELVDKALRELPDQIDISQLWDWGMRHGVTMDELISRMGGSP